MSRFRLSERADRDLREIWDYISAKNPDAADRQLDMLHDRFALLAKQPRVGQLREDLHPKLRVFPAGSYVIFYYPLEEGIEVVGVVHGARDIESMFQRGER